MVKKIEFPILRWDLGFSNERPKSGIAIATAGSWGHFEGPTSMEILTIDAKR